MERCVSAIGLVVLLAIAWLMSENRRRMNWRLIASGLSLQFVLAVFLLRTPIGQSIFDAARGFVDRLVSFSDAGAEFVFGPNFRDHYLAFSVLPTIIFISSLTAIFFHLGVLQRVVKVMAWIMVRVMDTSGAESLSASADVYVGMTEAPLVIRPYLATMTRSELMAMMTTGMATVAGGVMAAYVRMGADAGHLLTASLLAAPASLVIAKIMVPETETSPTKGTVRVEITRTDANVLDAACRGASDGLKLALNVAAMMIAFYAIIHALNWMLTPLPHVGGEPLTLERLLGWILAPLAWVLGIEWKDAQVVGMLLGKKTVFNEFVAYQDLVTRQGLSDRSFTIATYALCGFANFASVAIMVGGIGSLEPSRRAELARYGMRAMAGGALATLMTAAVAGTLL